MGQVTKKLFGGSEQKQQSQSTSQSNSKEDSFSTSFDMTPEELKTLRDPFVQALTGFIASGGGPQYSGPFTAPMAAGEAAALPGIAEAANNPMRQNLLNATLSGQFLPGQAGANPFLEAAITAAQRPTFQGLEEVLSRTLPGRFAQAGQFSNLGRGGGALQGSPTGGSSAFDRAAAIATRGATQEAGDIATRLSAGAYESERGRQQSAIQLQQADVDTMVKNLQSQGLPRLIEKFGVELGLTEFRARTEGLLKAFAIAAGAPIAQVGQTAESHANSSASSQSTSSGEGEMWKGIVPAVLPKGLQGG